MAAGLIVEFEGQTQAQYESVGKQLGIDLIAGAGDWPAGLLSHAAGATASGWRVVEVWESRDQQERFLQERLRPALKTAGVHGPPSREEWVDLAAYHTPGGRETGSSTSGSTASA
jgi:hypothetical protein